MSQIATTIEQSKRLLAAGLDPKSADMMLVATTPFIKEFDAERVEWLSIGNKKKGGHWNIPAWSLSRLWDICNDSGIGPFNFGGDDIDSSSLIEKLVHWIILGVHDHEVLDEYLTAEKIQELNREYANH